MTTQSQFILNKVQYASHAMMELLPVVSAGAYNTVTYIS